MIHKICGMVIACILACGSLLSVEAAQVKPSTVEYKVVLNEYSKAVFVSNEKPVNVGDAVYMTYTVKEVTKDTSHQNGVVATTDRTEEYPYEKNIGMMEYYDKGSLLLKQGYTYFCKFQITDYGFDYVISYSNGTDEGYETGFNITVNKVIDNMRYFGIWIVGPEMAATLTHVRCYDASGNNLGIYAKNAFVDGENYQGNSKVADRYSFELDEATNVAISNAKYSTADIVYMEYTVGESTDASTQAGIGLTNQPTESNPYQGNSCLYFYENYEEGQKNPLTIPGAKYLIRFERTDKGFVAAVKRVLNGETSYMRFKNAVGKYNDEYGYYYLYFTGKITATFDNFKCYDAQGNNLGVQLNKPGVDIKHAGGIEDYSICAGTYYCQANEKMITLDEKQNVTLADADSTTNTGGYVFYDWELRLVMNIGGKESDYEYSYDGMTDEDGNKYIRLKDQYTVKFVDGSETKSELVSKSSGYKVSEPEKPQLKGNTFKGWCLGTGEEYDFDNVVTESMTLYAKWADKNGNEYLAVEVNEEAEKMDITPVIVVTACVLMVALVTVVSVKSFRKKKDVDNHAE